MATEMNHETAKQILDHISRQIEKESKGQVADASPSILRLAEAYAWLIAPSNTH